MRRRQHARLVDKEADSSIPTQPEGDDLAIILNAFRFHPEAGTRKALGDAVQDWLRALRPSFSRTDVEAAIAETRGTVIEPFWLNSIEQEIAVSLVLAWSSDQVDHSAIRIVSSDALHTGGGLVFNRSGVHNYSGIFCQGEKVSLSTPYFFAPGLMSKPIDMKQPWRHDVPAEIFINEDGARVMLYMSRPEFQVRETLRLAQDSARVLRRDLRLSQMGVRFGSSAGGMSLSTGSAESLIRFIALCEEHEQIQIDWRAGNSEVWSCVIDLQPTETDRQSIRATLYPTTNGPYRWINLPLPPIRLSRKLYAELAEWTVPHTSWAPILRKMENETEQGC